jgi:hypothetical protein
MDSIAVAIDAGDAMPDSDEECCPLLNMRMPSRFSAGIGINRLPRSLNSLESRKIKMAIIAVLVGN